MDYYLYPQFLLDKNWAKTPKKSFSWDKKWLFIFFFSLIFTAILPFFDIKIRHQKALLAEPAVFVEDEYLPPLFNSFQENTAFATAETYSKETDKTVDIILVIVTGYSSTPWQTDDTPFITASGTWVREGIVAANFLPIGTEITIPEIYGGKVFVVEDRMHPRNYWNVDIWFPTYIEAKNFGAVKTYIEILEN